MTTWPSYQATTIVAGVSVHITAPAALLNGDDQDVQTAFCRWGVSSIGSMEALAAAVARGQAKAQFSPPWDIVDSAGLCNPDVLAYLTTRAPMLQALAATTGGGALDIRLPEFFSKSQPHGLLYAGAGRDHVATSLKGTDWTAEFSGRFSDGTIRADFSLRTPPVDCFFNEKLTPPCDLAQWAKATLRRCRQAAKKAAVFDTLGHAVINGVTVSGREDED